MLSGQTMKQLRRVHHYLGVFFAPAIIVFALSGALQTFRLQETRGYGGTPPGWIVALASFHTDQALPRAERPGAGEHEHEHEPPKAPQATDTHNDAAKAEKRSSTLPLKIFVATLAVALITSAFLGVIIALNNKTMRRTSAALLGLGAIVPLLLLFA